MPCVGELDTDEELGRRDRGDGDIVLVVNHDVERCCLPFRRD